MSASHRRSGFWLMSAAVVALALLASMITGQPAAAEDEAPVVESQPPASSPGINVIEVSQTGQLVTVSNPGDAAPIPAQCTSAPLGGGSICVGTPDEGRRIFTPL